MKNFNDENDKEKISTFCLRIPDDLKEKAEIVSRVYKRSLNKQINFLIEKFVEENDEILLDYLDKDSDF